MDDDGKMPMYFAWIFHNIINIDNKNDDDNNDGHNVDKQTKIVPTAKRIYCMFLRLRLCAVHFLTVQFCVVVFFYLQLILLVLTCGCFCFSFFLLLFSNSNRIILLLCVCLFPLHLVLHGYFTTGFTFICRIQILYV